MMTATALRKDLYDLLKHVDEKPIFFTYKGQKYSVVPAMDKRVMLATYDKALVTAAFVEKVPLLQGLC